MVMIFVLNRLIHEVFLTKLDLVHKRVVVHLFTSTSLTFCLRLVLKVFQKDLLWLMITTEYWRAEISPRIKRCPQIIRRSLVEIRPLIGC